MTVKGKSNLPTKEKTKPKEAAKKAMSLLPAPLKAITQKQTQSQILKDIAEKTELSIKQVRSVLIETSYLAKCHLVKKGSGEFLIPEMAIKLVRKTKPATKKREGRNPATGETILIAAKPKSEVIRIRPLKALKEIVV